VIAHRKSVGKRLNEKKSNSNINKYTQSVYIVYTFVYTNILHIEKIRFVMNEAAKGIRTILLVQEFRWHFSFNIALNFTRILPTKRKLPSNLGLSRIIKSQSARYNQKYTVMVA